MLFVLLVAGSSLVAAPAKGITPASEHPLVPVLKMAYDGVERMEQEIEDYTCLLTKRERVRGRLFDHETMYVKVRHRQVERGRVVRPFSVYVRFLRPERVKNREVVYVEGKNGGKMIVRNGGTRFEYITTALAPDSPTVLQQTRYPISEIGVLNLTRRLIEDGEYEMQHSDDCRVRIVPGAKINGRSCTLVQVAHPEPRETADYQMARILIDDQLVLPVHYSAYDWPDKEGGQPQLLEEYTYTNIRINVGLTDWDFDHRNENYLFLKGFTP
jgi:hypothetical protein